MPQPRMFGLPPAQSEHCVGDEVLHRPVPPIVMSFVCGSLLKWPYSESAGEVTPPGPPARAHIAATTGDASDVPPIVSHPLAP